MRIENGELVATGAQLAAAPAVLDLEVGALARLPRMRATEADEDAVQAFLDGAQQDIAALSRAMLTTLAAPVRTGVLHYALGEESMTRAALFWGPATGTRAVMMVAREDDWALASVTPEELTDTLASVLLEGVPLSPARLRLAMSQDAACAFLAILHLLRGARLIALLDHEVAPVSFTAEDVVTAIEKCGVEDFRWPFLFLDKLLPYSLNALEWSDAIGPALRELTERGLIELAEEDSDIFLLSRRGYQFFVADAQHFTKAGLRVTAEAGDGGKGHETFLFLRSLQDLIMIDLGGREAVMASIPFEDLRTLVGTVLTPPEKMIAARPTRGGGVADAAAPSQASERGPLACTACGQDLEGGARFCPRCGNAVVPPSRVSACIACGETLRKGAKFCPACGTRVKEEEL